MRVRVHQAGQENPVVVHHGKGGVAQLRKAANPVNHATLDGQADTNLANDECPRAANPATKDKGCGGKGPDRALVTDVVEK